MLATIPEVSIRGDGPTLAKQYAERIKTAKRLQGSIVSDIGPETLLATRPDLARLPIIPWPTCKSDPRAARVLTEQGRNLHTFLDTISPRDAAGKRTDPEGLRQVRKELHLNRPDWVRVEAIPSLRQVLMPEDAPLRALLVEILSHIPERQATVVLAQRAVFDLSPEVRGYAVAALRSRPSADYRPTLYEALRYPWAPAADHAAEALVALNATDAAPYLVSLLDKPDPSTPFENSKQEKRLREVVRLNHLTSCLACHAPALTTEDPVLGVDPFVRNPDPSAPSTSRNVLSQAGGRGWSRGGGGGGGGGAGTGGAASGAPLFIRGDIVYLRQDFSVEQPLKKVGDVRFDYLIRTRPLTYRELSRYPSGVVDSPDCEQRDAVLFALRALTGKDLGSSTEAWQQEFPRAVQCRGRSTDQGVRRQSPGSTTRPAPQAG